MQDTVVRARVSQELKEDSEEVFRELGITTTEAIRMFLSQVKIHGGLPFAVRTRQPSDDLLRSVESRKDSLDSFYDD